VELRCAWGEERVYFYDDTGRLRRLAAAWTTAVTPSTFEIVSAGRSHFRIEDLLHLVALIARQTEASGSAEPIPHKDKVLSKECRTCKMNYAILSKRPPPPA